MGNAYLKTWRYNRKFKEKPLREGDLFLRKMETTKKGSIQEKLTPNHKGPHMTNDKVGPSTFQLATLQEDGIPKT